MTVEAVEPGETADTTVALTSAEIVYTNGCVSADHKLRKDADITFKLVPKAGKKLDTVRYTTKGTAADATASTAQTITPAADGTYKIEKSNLVHGTPAVNDVNVTIVVSFTDIAYTVKAASTTSTDYKLYPTKADATDATKTLADTGKEITTAGLADKITYAKKDDVFSFAVVANDSVTSKIRSVKVQAGNGEAKTLTSTANTADTKPAPIYTFKASELADIDEYDNQDITITVEATESATITIDKTGLGAGATIATVANAKEVYGENGFADASSASSAKEGQKVIFTVTMDEAYKDLTADDVTAALGTEDIAVEAVGEQTKGEGNAAKKVPAHYMIDLADATEAATLSIKVNTELKDTANKVTFESVSENSIITEASETAVLNGKTIKVKDATYSFDAKAKPGYKIYAIGASYTKKYKPQDGKTTPADKAVVNEGLATGTLKPGSDGAPVGKTDLSGVQVEFSGKETIDGTEWDWTTDSITVKVNANMDEVAADKIVTFTSEYDYEVKTGDKIAADETDDNVYTVKTGAELFEFTVDAEAEPTVVAKNGETNILLGEPTKAETGGWTYQIAAGALADEDQTIKITRKSFAIAVDYDHTNVSAEVYDHTDFETAMTGSTSGSTDTYSAQTADYTYKFLIEPKNDNTKISKVSYTIGDSEEAEEVTAKGGSYVFYVDLTAAVHVTVETKDEYDLVVKEGGEAVTPDTKKVYNVGHASEVTAQLLNGTTKQALFNAEVKDGSAVAATYATIADDVVTLHFDASEYNKELTVILTLKNKERTQKTFKVKTTAAAAEVSIAGVKGGKVDLPVDTKASYKLTVKTKNASLDSIGVNVVPADDAKKADAAAVKAANDAVDAKIVDGNLVITAKPAMTGAEGVAKVIVVDKSSLTDAQIKATTVDNALKNGIVTVNTKDATIVGKEPTVTLVSTTDQTIKVKLGVPKEVVDPEAGKIFYKVELTVPQSPTFPEGTTDAAKTAITNALTKAATDWNNNNANLYQEKKELDKKGGLLEIPVMAFADGVAADLKKGVLMSGFSVKVTLQQTTKETTAANNFTTDAATIIAGGTKTLENLATKNPYYEVKLGLKKGTTNLITGQNKDVVIATPNFNKLTSYSGNVKVEFVNTASGGHIGGDASTDGDGNADGNNAEYSADYCGLYAKYDELQNAVIVNAVDAWYGNYDEYKNLGVKVTAYAEDSAYGAVATQKITVANGIQEINPSAPYEIYKQGTKAASLTVTTDLNSMSYDKKNAPKSKKLKYEIVDATTETKEALSSDLKANVTVKNGKVTINGKYIVKAKDSENLFKVKVIADDYQGNSLSQCTDPILIKDEPMEMGTIAVFDVADGEGSAKIVALNDGALEATKRSGEYRVAVLQPNVKTTKKTYDLGESSADVMDPSLFTFKSSSAKNVAVALNTVWDGHSRDIVAGDLTINKAAKNVKITVLPKDGSKLDKKLTTLNLKTVGQVSSAAPLLRISRYKGSVASEGAADREKLYEGGATTINYSGNSTNNYFRLDVVKSAGEGTYESFYLANYQISFSGAKLIGKKTEGDNGDYYKIVANAKEAKITLKNKAVSNAAPIVYTLVNDDCVTDNKAKAPKISTTAKLAQNTGARYVSYSIKGGSQDDDLTGNYVMLSADQTKKNPDNIGSVVRDLDKPLPIILGQRFNLYVNTGNASGNYNLVATVGTLKDGEFKPLYKDAKVVVKIAKQGKANLSVTGNYTVPLKSSSGVYLKYKSGNGWIRFTNEADESGNYAKNAIINGQENHFKDYFEVAEGYNGIYVALKADLPLTAPANNASAPALDKIVSDAYKNDRIGYISVDNGAKYLDVKLTITLKDYTKDNTKYKVTATPVLDGPNAVTSLTILEGKNPVDVAWMAAGSENGIFKPASGSDGEWYLEAANLTPGSHKVDLYMVSYLAADAYLDAIEKASGDAQTELIKQYGVKTSITVKATDKSTTKNKVALVNKGSNKWNVADTDYNYTGWSKYTPFSFKSGLSLAANADVINTKATVNGKDVDYVTFELSNKKWMTTSGAGNSRTVYVPTSYGMTIKLDKTKLATAITKDAADDTIAAKNKLNWGKTVKVKATFSYGADVPVADELTFDIKLPANAGAADADIKKALTDAQDTLQSNIETYYNELKIKYNTSTAPGKVRINSLMETYIENEVKKAVQGGAVTVTITGNGNNESGSEALATSWDVLVKSTAAGTAEVYKNTFAIPAVKTISEIKTAIAGLNLADSVEIKDGENLILTVTAKTTAAEFAAAVRKKLGAAATRNISITAAITEKKEPTVGEKGSIKFSLTVKDLSKSPKEEGYLEKLSDVSYDLEKLDNLDACKTKITAGLDAAAISKIVNDAKIDAPSGLEAEVQRQLVAKANTLITNNENITVKGIATKDGSPVFGLVAPKTAAKDANAKIYFTLELQDVTTGAEHEAADLLWAYGDADNQKALDACPAFQNLDELKAAITAFNKVTIPADGNLPTEAEVIGVIQAELQKLKTGVDLTNTTITAAAETTDESNKTTYTKDADGKVTKVEKLKVTISGVNDPITIASISITKATATP